MRDRLLEIIEYKSGGKQADFAELMGWSPQYLNRLTKGESGIGIRPVVAILEMFPEINARWFLLGEGAMLSSAVDKVKARLIKLLEIEKYMPVMTPSELRELSEGKIEFEQATIDRWSALLDQHNKEINDRFNEAYKRQEELCRQNKAK